jgi:ADP-heptose:LPS heptosyltransferase
MTSSVSSNRNYFSEMPALTIRIKKNRDGTAALSCTRADGTVTRQKQNGQQARFFPRHDLTHYAVETVLGHRKGFYGMVADGWNLTDFGAPWPRGPMPADMDPSELIVGFLDTERASGTRWTVEDFNDKMRLYNETHHTSHKVSLTDDDLARVRKRRSELFAMWDAVPPGETLELQFDP